VPAPTAETCSRLEMSRACCAGPRPASCAWRSMCLCVMCLRSQQHRARVLLSFSCAVCVFDSDRAPALPPACLQFAKLRHEGCSFLVAGRRDSEGRFRTLADLVMPEMLPQGVRTSVRLAIGLGGVAAGGCRVPAGAQQATAYLWL
jgi:hypothetical protein